MASRSRGSPPAQGVSEGELSVTAGEVVTLTDLQVGQGWWGARATDGRWGIKTTLDSFFSSGFFF